MAVIVLASASGAPGVTTSALAMALVWPRPVLLVEADVAGGSSILAGYLRGAVSPAGRSLLGVAIGQRQNQLEASLERQTVPLDDDGTRRLVPAIAEVAQAASLAPVWGPLATAFASLERDGVDVLVDAGRLGAVHGPEPLVANADLVLLVTRTHLPGVASARARTGHLREMQNIASSGGIGLGLLLIGDGRPYTGPEITQATDVPVLAAMTWDPAAAEVLSVGAPRPRRWAQSAFVRSARTGVEAVEAGIARRRAHLSASHAAGARDHSRPTATAGDRSA